MEARKKLSLLRERERYSNYIRLAQLVGRVLLVFLGFHFVAGSKVCAFVVLKI